MITASSGFLRSLTSWIIYAAFRVSGGKLVRAYNLNHGRILLSDSSLTARVLELPLV